MNKKNKNKKSESQSSSKNPADHGASSAERGAEMLKGKVVVAPDKASGADPAPHKNVEQMLRDRGLVGRPIGQLVRAGVTPEMIEQVDASMNTSGTLRNPPGVFVTALREMVGISKIGNVSSEAIAMQRRIGQLRKDLFIR